MQSLRVKTPIFECYKASFAVKGTKKQNFVAKLSEKARTKMSVDFVLLQKTKASQKL
jgi:hypothetical protein